MNSPTNGIKGILQNLSWLFADRMLQFTVGLGVSIWVSRYLGPAQFGTFSYAIAVVSLFGTFASLGLRSVVIRELLQKPTLKTTILGSAFVLLLFSGILSVLASLLFAYLTDQRILLLVGIIAVGLLFQSMQSAAFYFEAHLQSKYLAYANNSAYLLASSLKVLLILTHAPLFAFGAVSALEIVFSSVMLVFLYQKVHTLRIWKWRFSKLTAQSLLNNSYPIILTSLMIVIYTRTDQMMIRHYLSEREVGYYAAAIRLSEVWYFVPMLVQSSLFPSLIKFNETSSPQNRAKRQAYFSLMTVFSYLIAIPTSLLAKPIISILYGQAFMPSAIILSISIWTLPFVSLGVARNAMLVANNQTKLPLFFTTCGALLNVGLSIMLVPRMGALGAGLSTLVSQVVSSYLSSFFLPSTIHLGLEMTRAIFLPNLKLIRSYVKL